MLCLATCFLFPNTQTCKLNKGRAINQRSVVCFPLHFSETSGSYKWHCIVPRNMIKDLTYLATQRRVGDLHVTTCTIPSAWLSVANNEASNHSIGQHPNLGLFSPEFEGFGILQTVCIHLRDTFTSHREVGLYKQVHFPFWMEFQMFIATFTTAL